MPAFTYERPPFNPVKRPKPGRIKVRFDRREDEKVYRANRLIALEREKHRCQLCAIRAREVHHVGERKRSKTRGKPPEFRHHPGWLMAVCGCGNVSGCHALLESGEVKVYGNALAFTCERYDDDPKVQDWRPWVPPAKRKKAA